jgi:hypothetical protein
VNIGQLKVIAQGKPIIIGRGAYYLNDKHYRRFGVPHKSIQPKATVLKKAGEEDV